MSVKSFVGFCLAVVIFALACYLLFFDEFYHVNQSSNEESSSEAFLQGSFLSFFTSSDDLNNSAKHDAIWMQVRLFMVQNYAGIPCKQLDCSVFRPICRSMNVTEFPAIAWIHNGSVDQIFDGRWEIEDIKAFIVAIPKLNL